MTASFAGASSSSLTQPTDVTLTFGAGEDAEAADFTAPGAALTVSIPAGSTTSSATALTGLLITGDAIAEGAEKIDIGGTAGGFRVSGTELGIADDDLGVTVEADTDSVMNGEQKNLSEGTTPAVRVRAKFTTATSNDLGSALQVRVAAGVSSPQSAVGRGNRFHRSRYAGYGVHSHRSKQCGKRMGEPDRTCGYGRCGDRAGGNLCHHRYRFRGEAT